MVTWLGRSLVCNVRWRDQFQIVFMNFDSITVVKLDPIKVASRKFRPRSRNPIRISRVHRGRFPDARAIRTSSRDVDPKCDAKLDADEIVVVKFWAGHVFATFASFEVCSASPSR